MKNVLIPTTLKEDTLKAVRTAVRNANGSNLKIVLLILSEMPDGITNLLFATQAGYETSAAEQRVLNQCRQYAKNFDTISLIVHHQYGITAPLLRNIMNHHTIGFIMLTPSYKTEKDFLHKTAVKLLNASKCPILHLTDTPTELILAQAIYVENPPSQISMTEIQHFLKDEFDIRVISQTTLQEGQNPEDLKPVLVKTIEMNNINLVVETRKPQKTRLMARKSSVRESLAEKLGVPVLSVCDN
jgi:hypothetical protein